MKVIPIHVSSGVFKNYCYLIFDEKTRVAVLVDPAWEQDKIEEVLLKHELQLIALLITHHHHDHTNLAAPLSLKYRVPVYMSEVTADYYGNHCENQMCINTGRAFSVGALKIKPFCTPGHTKGCVCYFIEDNLFTGDVLFNEGCGICSGKDSSPAEMFKSLDKIKSLTQPDTYIYPGHSFGSLPGQKFSTVLSNNIYLHIDNEEKFVTFRMRPNQRNLFRFY